MRLLSSVLAIRKAFWSFESADRLAATSLADVCYGATGAVGFRLLWGVSRVLGTPVSDLSARTGRVPPAAGPLLWFHGASCGELSAGAGLVALLRAHGFRFTAAYTATNDAGVAFAAHLGDGPQVTALAPWDAPGWVRRAFDRWQPAALFLVETEIWPRLIFEASRRHIPVFAVSGRIYPRDVRRYRAIRFLIAPALRRLTEILAQSELERQRFIRLGAAPQRCWVGGNLKHLVPRATAAAGTLRAALQLRPVDRVVAFGSVHVDEIALVVEALGGLQQMDDVRVIIAPRHQAGCEPLLRALQRLGWRTCRRSAGALAAAWQALVLDTMGELRQAYALAHIAVVGGGFAPHGGHNPIEPLAAGAPVILGPHFDHFSDEATAILAATPAAGVRTAAELAAVLERWLRHDALRRDALARQHAALPDGEAIAKQYLAVLSPWLPEPQSVCA